MGLGLATPRRSFVVTFAGAALLAAYVWHALQRRPTPIIDLRLLAIPTYRAGVVGGFLFRTGLGAGPFLLPLLFQVGLRHDGVPIGHDDVRDRHRRDVDEDAGRHDPAALRLPPGAVVNAVSQLVRRRAGAVHGRDRRLLIIGLFLVGGLRARSSSRASIRSPTPTCRRRS